MEKKGKIILIGIIILVIIIGLIIGVVINKKEDPQEQVGTVDKEEEKQEEEEIEEKYTVKLEDGSKINVSEEFNTTKRYKDLEISNIQYTEKNGITVLLADVKNIGTSKHEIEIVKIAILGENGETITELNPIIGEIEVGETIKINANVSADVVNAKDLRIEEAEEK